MQYTGNVTYNKIGKLININMYTPNNMTRYVDTTLGPLTLCPRHIFIYTVVI